ncbi:hypothetical protein DIPPA_35135 [Diplonema papillatum]|nr:hypothetical protein DIPPA_35135 [Diplonema papillatum]
MNADEVEVLSWATKRIALDSLAALTDAGPCHEGVQLRSAGAWRQRHLVVAGPVLCFFKRSRHDPSPGRAQCKEAVFVRNAPMRRVSEHELWVSQVVGTAGTDHVGGISLLMPNVEAFEAVRRCVSTAVLSVCPTTLQNDRLVSHSRMKTELILDAHEKLKARARLLKAARDEIATLRQQHSLSSSPSESSAGDPQPDGGSTPQVLGGGGTPGVGQEVQPARGESSAGDAGQANSEQPDGGLASLGLGGRGTPGVVQQAHPARGENASFGQRQSPPSESSAGDPGQANSEQHDGGLTSQGLGPGGTPGGDQQVHPARDEDASLGQRHSVSSPPSESSAGDCQPEVGSTSQALGGRGTPGGDQQVHPARDEDASLGQRHSVSSPPSESSAGDCQPEVGSTPQALGGGGTPGVEQQVQPAQTGIATLGQAMPDGGSTSQALGGEGTSGVQQQVPAHPARGGVATTPGAPADGSAPPGLDREGKSPPAEQQVRCEAPTLKAADPAAACADTAAAGRLSWGEFPGFPGAAALSAGPPQVPSPTAGRDEADNWKLQANPRGMQASSWGNESDSVQTYDAEESASTADSAEYAELDRGGLPTGARGQLDSARADAKPGPAIGWADGAVCGGEAGARQPLHQIQCANSASYRSGWAPAGAKKEAAAAAAAVPCGRAAAGDEQDETLYAALRELRDIETLLLQAAAQPGKSLGRARGLAASLRDVKQRLIACNSPEFVS